MNDNAPMFLANKYEARLLENSLDFENPLVLEARDLDLNGELFNKYLLLIKKNYIITLKNNFIFQEQKIVT